MKLWELTKSCIDGLKKKGYDPKDLSRSAHLAQCILDFIEAAEDDRKIRAGALFIIFKAREYEIMKGEKDERAEYID